jgi:hypothetical protein
VREIAEVVLRAFPQAELKITGETGGDPRSYRVAFDKAARLPGFTASWTLAQGVDELSGFLHRNGLKDQAFDSRLFVRLKQLQHGIETGRLDLQLRRQPESSKATR